MNNIPNFENFVCHELYVNTMFKLKYHDENLDKALLWESFKKQNEMVVVIDQLLTRIKKLEEKINNNDRS